MSRKRAAHRRGRQDGFTLLEILVAMTLLGLVMVMIFGGLRLGARVWEAGDERAEARARIEIVQRFLRTYVSQAHPLMQVDQDTNKKVAFAGHGDGVEFATLMPPHLSAGGFNHVAVSTADDGAGTGRNLVVRFALLQRDDDNNAVLAGAEDAEPTVLLDGIAAAAFSYYGAQKKDEEPEWHERWEGELLPQLVRLRVRFPDGDGRTWPELTMATGNVSVIGTVSSGRSRSRRRGRK
jgi:general secretion pathway protein J